MDLGIVRSPRSLFIYLMLLVTLVGGLLSIVPSADAQGEQLVVRAAGKSGGEKLQVVVEDKLVATITLRGSMSLSAIPFWQDFPIEVPASTQASQVIINYINDTGIDRDVRVDRITLHGSVFETEAAGVLTTGGWGNGANCGTGYFEVDYLACAGGIRYSGDSSSPGTTQELVVTATGETGDESLEVQVAGQEIDTIALSKSDDFNNAPEWRDYRYSVDSAVTAADVVLRFRNDQTAPGYDRNLRVDHIVLGGVTYETEEATVRTTGSWGNGSRCDKGTFSLDNLYCNGEISYGGSGSDGGGATGIELIVRAAGATGDERLEVRIDGRVVETLRLGSSNDLFGAPRWRSFSVPLSDEIEVGQVQLGFVNDEHRAGYDRNLRVDWISLNGVVHQTEARDVTTNGGWGNGSNCNNGNFRLDNLVCNGTIDFGSSGGVTPAPQPTPSTTGNAQQLALATKDRLSRTINLGNALEAPDYEGQWGVVIRDWMFPTIKQAGYTAVRVPVRWSAHASPNAPYTIDPAWFDRVDHVIQQARHNDLAVVLNIHHYEELNSDPAGHHDRFLSLWEQISARYQNQPDTVSFELLNEPFGALSNVWNQYARDAFEVVRRTNPDRTVLIGPTGYNKLDRLSSLELPDDRNIVLSVHYYDPFEVTHQGADWIQDSEGNTIHPVGVACCDQTVEEQIRSDMEFIAQWAEARDRPVFIGEFGAIDHGTIETRADWTAHVRWRSQDQGFAWAYWEFSARFGVFDSSSCQWNLQLHDALRPGTIGDLAVNGVGCTGP